MFRLLIGINFHLDKQKKVIRIDFYINTIAIFASRIRFNLYPAVVKIIFRDIIPAVSYCPQESL
ncbi:hypothetical protein BK824_34780 [Klebsiella pneumoniae]|nr:hypothetical protein A9J37_03485 [Klebsiella pneumoniae]ERN57489.1 hypothetical protein N598_22595 [Klebsiella pneumoniae 303K]KGK52225.1 hypothetical protein EU63_06380 [Klebsiella pneumoniae]KYL46909.1 hypothetical protein AT485_18950 [Klebsiella pneumoniae]KYL49752.1 hypothetical protein AT486_00975 [Klebsiella pneumoniae]